MFVQKQNFGVNVTLRFNFQLKEYDYPAHIHQFPELCYVIDGSLELMVNDRVLTLCGGDYLFVAPLQVHGYYTPERCNAVVMAFPESLLPECRSIRHYTRKCAQNPSAKAASDYFEAIFLCGGLGTEHYAAISQDGESKAFFVDLTDEHHFMRASSALRAMFAECESSDGESGGDDGALTKLLVWLGEHFTEPIKLENAAQALGYSRNYLSHRIKKLSGMSFNELLSNLRVDHARKLLGHEMTVLDAALDSGFETERSFYRTFKKITGMTPGEYLRKR